MSTTELDEHGYRRGVGMVILNQSDHVFLGCRMDAPEAWQFPQGGINLDEAPVVAMYRELAEEVGLQAEQVELIAQSQHWHHYELPTENRIIEGRQVVGQKQQWFLLRLIAKDSAIQLDKTGEPEFCRWRWAEYWEPLSTIIVFKKAVYQKVLEEFSVYLKK